MDRIKLDINLIKSISLFQKVTKVSPKDCIDNSDFLIFIIPEVLISKAIGTGGSNAKKLERILNRKIKIVGYNPNVLQFTRNVIFPYKAKEIIEEEGIIKITPKDSYVRGKLIGRNANRLRKIESVIKRYFSIKEIKVI